MHSRLQYAYGHDVCGFLLPLNQFFASKIFSCNRCNRRSRLSWALEGTVHLWILNLHHGNISGSMRDEKKNVFLNCQLSYIKSYDMTSNIFVAQQYQATKFFHNQFHHPTSFILWIASMTFFSSTIKHYWSNLKRETCLDWKLLTIFILWE